LNIKIGRTENKEIKKDKEIEKKDKDLQKPWQRSKDNSKILKKD
jgi:hypothetical protein